MGQYRFAIPASNGSDRFSPESLMTAQVIGLEGIPWPCKTHLQENVLTLIRNQQLSGRLLVPFRTTNFGELALTTGTLPEVDKVYLLELELARGSLSRLRNQISIWQEGGLEISDDFTQRIEKVIQEFSEAVFLNDSSNEAKRIAICEATIDAAVELMFELTDEYSRQIALIHQSQSRGIPVIAGAVADNPELLKDHSSIFEDLVIQKMIQPTGSISVDSSDQDNLDFTGTDSVIDWISESAERSIRIAGPIISFDNSVLPNWMPEDSDFELRMDLTRRMCRSFGMHYQKRIKILHAASGISGVGHQHFNYPQQLQMTLEMLEMLDQTMPNTSMMVSFDQPWGERLSMATGGVQSMEIADALLRYGARISAIGLEFNLDYWPQGTLLRDPFQWVDLIDRWSQFGLPLAIYFAAPTGDPNDSATTRFTQTIRSSVDIQAFQRYMTCIFKLLARRPAVNVIAWRRIGDLDNQRFPMSGLLDSDNKPKPILDWYRNLSGCVK